MLDVDEGTVEVLPVLLLVLFPVLSPNGATVPLILLDPPAVPAFLLSGFCVVVVSMTILGMLP